MTEQKVVKRGRGRPRKYLRVSKQTQGLRCGSCPEAKIYIVYGERQVFCKIQRTWHSVFDTCDLEEKRR